MVDTCAGRGTRGLRVEIQTVHMYVARLKVSFLANQTE